ncbi:MAG: hypothetical protein ACLT33_04430 [Lachnospira pectinoschiza]
MVAAVHQVVESYYGLAKALGLKVAFVDYAGNSTYQIMKQQIGPGVSLVIQVENDGTVINIFRIIYCSYREMFLMESQCLLMQLWKSMDLSMRLRQQSTDETLLHSDLMEMRLQNH